MGSDIPDCIKIILFQTGYDCEIALECLNEENLLQIEEYANDKLHDVINNLKCAHAETHLADIMKKQFKFLPGHRSLILSLPKHIALRRSNSETQPQSVWKQLDNICFRMKKEPALSNLLREIVKTAITNYQKTANLYRYSDIIQYFAIYIYMLCGRQCYEMISSNLPMPAASTIGTFIQILRFINL